MYVTTASFKKKKKKKKKTRKKKERLQKVAEHKAEHLLESPEVREERLQKNTKLLLVKPL